MTASSAGSTGVSTDPNLPILATAQNTELPQQLRPSTAVPSQVFLAVAKVLPAKIFEIGQAGSALVSPLSGKCKIACYQVVPSSPGITHRPSAATRPITMLS